MTEAKKSLKRTLIGKVVSDKRAKTVTVLIERRVKHELYGKIVGKSSKYHAHDEKGEYKMGDMIEITESRPISKTKNWVATRLVQKAVAVLKACSQGCDRPRGHPQRPVSLGRLSLTQATHAVGQGETMIKVGDHASSADHSRNTREVEGEWL